MLFGKPKQRDFQSTAILYARASIEEGRRSVVPKVAEGDETFSLYEGTEGDRQAASFGCLAPPRLIGAVRLRVLRFGCSPFPISAFESPRISPLSLPPLHFDWR